MSYLFDLLLSLNGEETIIFKELPLVGKEAGVRDAYLQHTTKSFQEDAIPAQLGLTQSHFDKLTSLLLDKTLTAVAPGNLDSQLEYLINKQLYRLCTHELKLAEKRTLKSGNKAELKAVYRSAFEAYIRFGFFDFAEQQIKHYCKAYVKLLDKSEEEQKYAVTAKMIEVITRYYSLRPQAKAHKKSALKQLDELMPATQGKNWSVALINIYIAYSACYEGADPEKALNYLTKAEEVALKLGNKLDDRINAFILVMKAMCFNDLNKITDAIDYYERALNRFPEIVGNRMYHTYNYCYVLLLAGQYQKAQVSIKKYLQPFLVNEKARNFHFDILRLYLMLALLTNDLKDAEYYTQRVLQMPKEDFTPFGDGIFRYVHNVYIAQSGDYELALSLIKKNLKFVNGKMEISGFGHMHKLLSSLAVVVREKRKQADKIKPVNLQAVFNEDGGNTVYARLLQNFMQLPPAVPNQ